MNNNFYGYSGGPCKTCEKNGCGSYHDECDQYLLWKKNIEELVKVRKKIKDSGRRSDYLSNYAIKNVNDSIKRKRYS